MNLTEQQLKLQEFDRKCFELSDKIHQSNLRKITITTCQLNFYGLTIHEVMNSFLEYLDQLQDQPHPETPFTWHVYATKRGDKFQLKFTCRLDLTSSGLSSSDKDVDDESISNYLAFKKSIG